MLSVLCVLFLGVLEGITEWLPVSSTGHLILLEDRLPLSMNEEFRELFDVVIQLGAILAVIILWYKDLTPLVKKEERPQRLRLWLCILLGVFPSAVAGYLLDEWIFSRFFNAQAVAAMLILWGILFLLLERLFKTYAPSFSSTEELTPRISFLIGLWQIFALLPGTSRSGATVCGSRLLGCSRECAARFSFFLAVPTMLGASLLKGVRYAAKGVFPSGEELLWLGIGSFSAFAVSLITLRFLTDYVRRHGFFSFGVYRILLGGLVLADYFL